MTNNGNSSNGIASDPIKKIEVGNGAKKNPRVRGDKKPGARGKRAGREFDPSRYAPSRNFPVVEKIVVFEHQIVRTQFERWFDVYKHAFFHTASMLAFLGMEEAVDDVHEHLLKMIEAEESELKAATATVLRSIKSVTKNRNVPKTSKNSASLKVEIPGFVVARYAEMYETADRFIDTCVYAECVGAMKWTERTALLRTVPRYLRAPAGRFQSFSARLGKRSEMNERQAKAARLQAEKIIVKLLKASMEQPGLEIQMPMARKKVAAG